MCRRLGTPDSSRKSISRARRNSRLPRFTNLLRPASLLSALSGSDRSRSHWRLLLPASDGLVALAVAGYDYSIDWTLHRGQAQEHLAIATAMYREMGMTYWLEQADREMRQLG